MHKCIIPVLYTFSAVNRTLSFDGKLMIKPCMFDNYC